MLLAHVVLSLSLPPSLLTRVHVHTQVYMHTGVPLAASLVEVQGW